MNPAEFNNYLAVSTHEKGEEDVVVTEPGKNNRQYWAAVVANLSSMAVGLCLGWTSPVNPKLSNIDLEDSPLAYVPSSDEMSWIASLVALGALIAPFAAGPLAGMFGRKLTLISSSIFFVLSFVLLALTCSVPQIYIARFLQGFGVGFVMTVQPMYIGEISSDDTRNALGAFMQLFIVLGILYAYVIGPYVSFVAFQYFCLAVPIVFTVAFIFFPDSPQFYIQKGRREDAIKALQFYRGKSVEGIQDELNSITESIEESMKNKGSISDVFGTSGNVKALIISAGLVTFQQLSGINVVLFYSQSIFEKTGSDLEPAIATILVGIVQVLASGSTPLLASRFGKKIILQVSAVGMGISLGLLGLYFFLDNLKSEIVNSIGFLPVLSLVIFVIVYCIGFGPLPWAVLGEMFPPNIKSIASSLVASTCWILGFMVTKYFATIQDALGSHWAFWIFSIFCGVAFLFTSTLVMETKGMSLQQIQDKLNGR